MIRKKIEDYIRENISFVIGQLQENEIDHVVDIALSIINTRDLSGPRGGAFVQAILANDLEKAVSCADLTCLKCIKVFVLVKLWFPNSK